jgi:hypothetical protein
MSRAAYFPLSGYFSVIAQSARATGPVQNQQTRGCIFIQPASGLVARSCKQVRVIPRKGRSSPVPLDKEATGCIRVSENACSETV